MASYELSAQAGTCWSVAGFNDSAVRLLAVHMTVYAAHAIGFQVSLEVSSKQWIMATATLNPPGRLCTPFSGIPTSKSKLPKITHG